MHLCVSSSSPIYTIATRDNYIASGDDDGRLCLWDKRSRDRIANFCEHHDFISAFLFHLPKKLLIASSYFICLLFSFIHSLSFFLSLSLYLFISVFFCFLFVHAMLPFSNFVSFYNCLIRLSAATAVSPDGTFG